MDILQVLRVLIFRYVYNTEKLNPRDLDSHASSAYGKKTLATGALAYVHELAVDTHTTSQPHLFKKAYLGVV